MRIHYELRANHRQQLQFVHYRLYTLLMHDSRLQHFFHCKLIDLLSLKSIAADAPHLAETSTANGVFVVEKVLVQGYI